MTAQYKHPNHYTPTQHYSDAADCVLWGRAGSNLLPYLSELLQVPGPVPWLHLMQKHSSESRKLVIYDDMSSFTRRGDGI